MSDAGDRARRGHTERSAPTPSDHERRALDEIDRFKNPAPTKLGSVLDRFRKPLADAADSALDNAVGQAIAKAVEGLINTLNEGTSWSVRTDLIHELFRSHGHANVHRAADIHQLELSEVDEVVRGLATKYTSVAFAEGASMGVLGFLGSAIDIPSLVSIALRAVGEYAAHYGFDPTVEEEKVFIVMLLGVACAGTIDERRAALTELTELSVSMADSGSRGESRRLLSVQMVTRVAHALAAHIVSPKMAQSIPVVGAGIGATYNAWFLKTLTESAFQLYRERFLIERHGPAISVPVRRRVPDDSPER